MNAKDWEVYVRTNSAALAKQVAKGSLPIAVEGQIIQVACFDIERLIIEGKLPPPPVDPN
jgi:hypothetical protein